MNFEEKGKIIATVVNKKDDKLNKDLYNEHNKQGIKNYIEEYICSEDETIQQIPNKKTERTILYITGASGSGKSYYTKDYIKEYHKAFPKNPIYFFSSLNDDPTIDKINYIKRVKLDNKFIDTQFTIDDFKNCLIIYDDTDVINNKMLKMKLQIIQDLILQTGRHTRTSMIYTSHIANRGNDTKMILNETHSITIFPNTLGGRTMKYLLENYFGLDKDQIKKIKKIGTSKSRWITILKTYPMIVLHQKGAYILNMEDKD